MSWRVLFSKEENSHNSPAHLQNSRLTIADWDKVGVACQTLLNCVGIQYEAAPKSHSVGNENAEASVSVVGGKEMKRVIQ